MRSNRRDARKHDSRQSQGAAIPGSGDPFSSKWMLEGEVKKHARVCLAIPERDGDSDSWHYLQMREVQSEAGAWAEHELRLTVGGATRCDRDI